MHKSLIIISFSLCVFSVSSQQSSLLEKYRSMAVSYNHDLKAADKIFPPVSNWKDLPVRI